MKITTLLLVTALTFLMASCAVEPVDHGYAGYGYYSPYYYEDGGPIFFDHSYGFHDHYFQHRHQDRDRYYNHDRSFHRDYNRGFHRDYDRGFHHDHDFGRGRDRDNDNHR